MGTEYKLCFCLKTFNIFSVGVAFNRAIRHCIIIIKPHTHLLPCSPPLRPLFLLISLPLICFLLLYFLSFGLCCHSDCVISWSSVSAYHVFWDIWEPVCTDYHTASFSVFITFSHLIHQRLCFISAQRKPKRKLEKMRFASYLFSC